jgi:hypothetical protein
MSNDDKKLETMCRVLQKENEALKKQVKSNCKDDTLKSLLEVLDLQRERIEYLEEGRYKLF